MPPTLPVYQDILNQPKALAAVLQNQLEQGMSPLERAAQAIVDAKQVVLVAIGASYTASFAFVFHLAEMGILVSLEDAAEMLHYKLQLYDHSTVFVLISRSGDTIEIAQLIEQLKERSAATIGITNVAGSSLGKNCDILLTLDCPADELIAIQTWSATVLVLNLLAATISGQLAQPEYRRQLQQAVQAVSSTCALYHQVSQDWKVIFQNHQSIYLLARGISQASAREGQLLFHEMAWHPATFYSAGHFRHGPWEIVEDGFLGFVFAPEDPCYSLNIGLAGDITRMGGQVVLITSSAPVQRSRNILTCPVTHLPSSLSPLVEIIPVQFFVYEYACWCGHQAGEFRASTPITLTEGEMANASD